MMVSWLEILKALVILAYRFAYVHISTFAMIFVAFLLLFKHNAAFRRTFWFFYRQFAAFGIVFVWCTLILPLLLLRKRRFENILTLAPIAKPVARLIGIRYEIRNKENMPADNVSVVIISNHPSILDCLSILYMIDSMKMLCTVTVTGNFFWLGPLGWVLHQCRCCFISRASDQPRSYEDINRFADAVLKKKIKIWFCPEGITSEELLPFKKGAFRIAIDKKVPIVPVVFSPHSFIDWDYLQAEDGKIIIDILPPISTAEYTHQNMNSLIERTHTLISHKYDELGEEIRSERREPEE